MGNIEQPKVKKSPSAAVKLATAGLFLGNAVIAANILNFGASVFGEQPPKGTIAIPTLVGKILGVEAMYDRQSDPQKTDSAGSDHSRNLRTNKFTYVKVPGQKDHDSWHQPDSREEWASVTFENKITTEIGMLVAGVSLAVRLLLERKRKKEDASDEKK